MSERWGNQKGENRGGKRKFGHFDQAGVFSGSNIKPLIACKSCISNLTTHCLHSWSRRAISQVIVLLRSGEDFVILILAANFLWFSFAVISIEGYCRTLWMNHFVWEYAFLFLVKVLTALYRPKTYVIVAKEVRPNSPDYTIPKATRQSWHNLINHHPIYD